MRPIIFLLLYCFFVSGAAYASTTVTTKNSPFEKPPLPNSFSVEYVLQSGFFDIGKTKRTLRIQDNGQYIFTSTTSATGMFSVFYSGVISEHSVWEYHNGRARPLQYSYKDTNNKKERDVSLKFDWNEKTVTNTINGEPWDMEITPDTQDKLIYQLNIMLSLLENSDPRILKINVADGGKLKTYDAVIEKRETIQTPAGEFETVRVNRNDGKRVTTLWCAPKLNYLPVRIEHYKKGKSKVNAYLVNVDELP